MGVVGHMVSFKVGAVLGNTGRHEMRLIRAGVTVRQPQMFVFGVNNRDHLGRAAGEPRLHHGEPLAMVG